VVQLVAAFWTVRLVGGHVEPGPGGHLPEPARRAEQPAIVSG